MRSKYLSLILLLFLTISSAIAQLGSTHYIPPLHTRIPFTNATIYLSTPNGDAANPINVTISSGDGTFLATRQIWNGQPAFYEIDLGGNSPISVNIGELSTPLTGRGIRLDAQDLIYASLRTYTVNHAGYLTAKGDDALGTRFRLGSAPLNPNNLAHNFFASIMATEDNTIINFSDIDPGVVFQNGPPGTQILNAGQSLVVSGYSDPTNNANNEGFIGTLLSASNPIVVNSGNLRGNLPNTDPNANLWSDHMIDQIVDESFTGFEYMLIRGGGNPELERPLIIANQDNTEILVNGNPIGVTLNVGEHILLDDDMLYLPPDITEVHRNMYISTDDESKSIYVYQFVGGRSGINNQNDPSGVADVPDATPGMNFIPPLNCFFQRDVNLIPELNEIYPGSIEEYFGNLLITAFAGSMVTVNGTLLDQADALQNPGTIDWETYYVRGLNGNVSVIADGPIAIGLFGGDNRNVAAGLGGSAGFGGYYSGFAVTPEDTETDVCTQGGPINLFERIIGNPPTGGVWTPSLDSGGDIFDPLTDPISNPTLVYNYVATGECEAIDIDVTVVLVENPVLDPIDDIEACDTFSLQDPSILTGEFLNNPQYYTGPQSDPTTVILDWTIPITTSTTIWVYDEAFAEPEICSAEFSFDINVNNDPIANPVLPQIVCDDDTNDGIGVFDLDSIVATILGTQTATDYTITFHESALEAVDGTNPIITTAAYNSTAGSIFARIENNLSAVCFDTTEIVLVVDEQPIANPVPPLIICDDDTNDGEEIFDLTATEPIILGTQNTADFDITFHTDLISAEAGTGALTGVNAITLVNGDSVFARIENDGNPNCFDTTEITITIDLLPLATNPGDFAICDNNSDGDDANGFTEFNLTSRDTFILNGQDPTLFTVSYHESLGDAQNDMNPLPALHTNSTINSQLIFARVENNANTTCIAIVSFEIIVHPLPVLLNTPVLLTQCDDDTDGFSLFNLTQAEPLISADFGNETFTYSDAGGTPIVDPINYTNQIVNNETVNVTVTTVNGCIRQAQIDLEVDTSEIPPDFLLEYIQCDTDGDGVAVFDFSDATAQVLALFPAGQMLTVTYYETVQEAQTEVNAIADIGMYANNLSFTDANGVQGIWVRVDGDTANDCRGLGVHVQLTVQPNPVLNTDVTDLVVCSPVANSFTFDLTQKDNEITNNNPDFVVSYYESLGAYIAQTPIANPTAYANLTNPQTIYYSAEDVTTGCITFDPDTTTDPDFSFDLVVNQNPILLAPSDLEVCDEDGLDDGFTTMDLTVKNLEITGGFDPELTISYHLDLAGAQADDASIPDPTAFVNTTNPQIVVARVENIITGCFSTINLRIEVFSLPIAITPAPYEECDPDNDGIFESFVLSSRDAEITGGDPTLTVVYYLTEADAMNAPLGLELDNMMYINNDPFTQTVWARVFNPAGCFDVVPLELVVLNTPMPNEMPDAYQLCDDNADGITIFDLTTQEAQILDGLDPAVYSVTWFIDQATADAGTPAIANPMAYTSNTNTVIAVITDIAQSTTTFCSEDVTLELIVNPLPIPIQPVAFEVCDDATSGSDIDEFGTFNLRSRDDEITGGNDDWIVSYHLTEVDADAGMPTLPDMYQNVVMADQTIWVRVEDVVTGCYELITMTLVVNPLPSPAMIPAVEECDDDGDGQAIFDLTTDVTTDIINGEAFVALTFHETPESAEIGTPLIADPANYQSVSRTLWVRATDTDPATATECFRVIEIELVVLPSPELPAVIDTITICDDDQDGQEIVDITVNDAGILGTQSAADFTLTYHETLMSATADVGSADDMPIADPVNYLITATPTTIFVRLENMMTGCTNTGQFDIIIAPQPVFNAPPAILEACDSAGVDVGTDDDQITTFDLTSLDAGITGGDPDLSVSYFESQADLDAGIAINPADAYINTGASPQTIFIQITSSQPGMCDAETTIDLVVNPLPVLPDPLDPITACDDDDDGFAEFDLQIYANALLATLTNIDIRFYETFDNAQLDDPANALDITMLYNNISGMTQLFIVAQDTDPATATACSKIFPVDLLVFPIPELPTEIPGITLCDEDGDGQEVFNLTQNDVIILGTQDPANFVITYHNDQASAEDPTPADAPYAPIVDPTNYVSMGTTGAPEIIWVRLETADGTDNTCFIVGNFELIVEPLPVVNPTGDNLDQEVCDDDNDEVATFDLTLNETLITGSNDNLSVTYYASLEDLASDTPIANPTAYDNILNPQTIQVVVSTQAGCSSMITFDIFVLPLPTPNFNPTFPELCDAITDIDTDGDGMIDVGSGSSTDGIEIFDLTTVIAEIQGTEMVTVTVFDDLAFAEADPLDPTNAIPDVTAFTNTTIGSQTLYARVDSDVPGNPCFVIVPFDVIVNPLPILDPAFDGTYTFCEDFDGDDTMGTLDFTTLADEIGLLLAPQNTADFTITYHDTQPAADTGFPALVSPYEVSDGEQLFIRIENTATGCLNFTDVTVTVESNPLSMEPDDVIMCADNLGINIFPEQDTATFNLNGQDIQIIGEGVTGITVVYYTSLEDAQNEENPIANPGAFVNTSNPQTIWARAENDTSLCTSEIVDFDLFVEPLPYTDLTNEGGVICVDEITGEVLEPFTVDGSVETPLPDTTYDFAWTLDGALISLDSVITINQAGTYQLTITATHDDGMGPITTCTYTAEVVYEEISAPVFEAVVVEDSFNPGGLYTVEVVNITSQGIFDPLSDFEFAIDNGPFQTSTTFTGVTPGTHTVFGRRVGEDCSVYEVEIGIIDYPRFFTPNNDDFHDTWNIIGIGVDPNLNAKIFIFDRYGKLIKQLSPTSIGWDGTFNGQPMPSSDYWFRVEFTEPDELGTQRTFTGHFTLKR